MAQQTNAQVVAAQLERVVDKIEVLYERGDDTLQLIQKANDVKTVSTRNMRIVLQVTAGGKGGSYNPDGGDLGIGSGESYDVATLSPVYKKMSFQMTSLAQWATDSDEKAIIDETNRIVSEGMLQFRAYLDKQVNATASFSLGTIGSIAGTTLTMNVPTGPQLVYENQTIQIYDTTQTINRSANAGVTTTVLATDPVSAQTIVVDQLPAGTIAGDVLMSDGLVGANPIDLFTIKYHQNNATTGVWQNLNRATYPAKLATPRVNGNNGALVPMQPWLAVNKIKKSLGLNKVGKLIAHMAVEQSQAWNQLAVTVQIIDRSRRETGEGQDMGIRAYDSGPGNMCGIPIKEAQNADQTRIDFLDLSVWGRAVMNPVGFYKGANGKVWFQIYGASGGIATAMQFHYISNFQLFNRNPRRGAFIDSLARPSGF
jgi:hypothetical protein